MHRCLRWYAYWGRIETPLDIIPTACFGGGAGLAVGLLLYGAGMRLRAARPRPAAVPGGAAGEAAEGREPERSRPGSR